MSGSASAIRSRAARGEVYTFGQYRQLAEGAGCTDAVVCSSALKWASKG